MVELTPHPISPQQVMDRVHRPSHGALVCFVGVAREESEGRRVRYLEYEAFSPMAEARLQELEQEIRERWGVEAVAIVHRVGRIEVGEVIVVIAVGSPHRREAFQACSFAIDRLKETVPIWKKEVFEDGERWVEG